jgi:hypothetical protein
MIRVGRYELIRLSTETVKGSALPLESVDDIEGGDGLSLGVLSVGNRVSDDVLEDWGSAMFNTQKGRVSFRLTDL